MNPRRKLPLRGSEHVDRFSLAPHSDISKDPSAGQQTDNMSGDVSFGEHSDRWVDGSNGGGYFEEPSEGWLDASDRGEWIALMREDIQIGEGIQM